MEGVYGSRESDWAGEDVCITRDGGALVANDCGAFGFSGLEKSPRFPPSPSMEDLKFSRRVALKKPIAGST